MKWKTLAGRYLYQSKSGIKVTENMVYRWLTFDSNAIQTIINHHKPSRPAMQYIQPMTIAARANPGQSCLLGLGGAGVAHALQGLSRLDTVESSLEVIEIATLFFMTSQIKNLNIIHQDALLFVQHTEYRYQHLMVDLFNAHSFPEHCNNAAFFEHCQRILLPNGILAVNLANLDEQWSLFCYIRALFFQCTVSIPVKGTANMIVLAHNGRSIHPLLDILKNQPFSKRIVWDARWGCVAET